MSFNLCSVGDIMPGENTHHFGRGIPFHYDGRFDHLLHPDVLAVINSADVFFGNFECSLMPDDERAAASLERAVYVAPESALALFDGIRTPVVLNVANNHFGQHGSAAADYTVQTLEKRGLHCIGRDAEPRILQMGERRLACWGASLVKSKNVAKTCFEVEPERLMEVLQWPEKKQGDVWVLSLHWGREYRTQPDVWQQTLAEQLVLKGVDVILGHHPHVIQPMQQIGQGTVCYSHGNFVFDQNFSRQTQEGLLCRIDPDAGVVETFLTRQRGYAVYLQDPVRGWLPDYCKKNYSKLLPYKMRVAMKAELLLHARHSNRETWRFFSGRLRRKFTGT